MPRSSRPALEVLYEDNHVLIVNKPAGMATMGAETAQPTAVQWAKQYLKRRYRKPGNVFLGVVSRLDAQVSGALVFARTSKAAARLTKAFRERQPHKLYWAIVAGDPLPPEGTWTDFLAKDEARQRMYCTRDDSRGKKAILSYQVLLERPTWSWLAIRLETGRKHQIRVQLATRGCPVVGDRKYGSRQPFAEGIALHARRLRLPHPVRTEPIDVWAPLPQSWGSCYGECVGHRDPFAS